MKIKFFEYSTILLPIYLYGIYKIVNYDYLQSIVIISICIIISYLLSNLKLKN